MKVNPQLVAVFFAGLFSGCLAGAVFTWWVNRPTPTTAVYTLTNATLGADSTIKGSVPNLKIQIGDEKVAVIHTHAIEIHIREGSQIDTADLALTFPTTVRFYGQPQASAPSPLHRINCTALVNGVTCRLGPLVPGGDPFRINMASDQNAPPSVRLLARGVQVKLLKSDDARDSSADTLQAFSRDVVPVLQLILASTGLLGLFLVWHQFKETSRWNKLQSEHTFLSRSSLQLGRQLSETAREVGVDLKARRVPLTEQEVEILWTNEKSYYAMLDYLNDIENTAYAVHAGMVDESIAYEAHSTRCIAAATLYRAYIDRLRRHFADDGLLSELDKLATKWLSKVAAERQSS